MISEYLQRNENIITNCQHTHPCLVVFLVLCFLFSCAIILRIIKLFRFSFFRRRIAVVQLTLEFSFCLLDRYHSSKSNSITLNE